MFSKKPEDVGTTLAENFETGNLEAVMQLCEPVELTTHPGQVATGTEALRAALAGFLATNPKFQVETKTTARAADIALVISKWSLSGAGPHGKPVNMGGVATDAVRLTDRWELALRHHNP